MIWINNLSPEAREALLYEWPFWGRANQLWPEIPWHTWLILAGRGWGKTRVGAEAVRRAVCGSTPLTGGKYRYVALVAETAADARDVLVEGPAGLRAVHPKDYRPVYVPSKRRLEWPNGAKAFTYNATEPDQLRGPQHDFAWLDELAKWRYAQETWDMMEFGLRLGDNPRKVITTTPRPLPIIKDLLARSYHRDSGIAVTRGHTEENAANLASGFIEQIKKRYEGTRLGRQELNAEILDDVPGALWTRKTIQDGRKWSDEKLPRMQRVVVGVDPAAKASADGDRTSETGIIVAGLGEDGRGYIIDDLSNRLNPGGWARKVCSAFDRYEADAAIVEINQGGQMVENVLRSERPTLPIRQVRATRSKITRAEPIAALYEQGRISHIGAFAELEDQMVLFTPFGIEGDGAADRVDALVWALTDLFPQMIRKDSVDWTKEPGYVTSSDGWMGR